jgi:glucosamine-6-phosphate deaminase
MKTPTDAIKSFKVGQLQVNIYQNRLAMGQAASVAVAKKIQELLATQNQISMVFAAAASQAEFLATLSTTPGIDWSKVVAFHMDEYLGLPDNHPQRFGNWLQTRIFNRVKPGKVFLINGNANPPEQEMARYTQLLRNHPLDIACIGIGENGHIAFNDPAFADFNDPLAIKVVAMDATSRHQQVHDGCFETFEQVPTHAFTLTIPALTSANWIYCTVPSSAKNEAVRRTLTGTISTDCPATILRNHPNAALFLDPDSAKNII